MAIFLIWLVLNIALAVAAFWIATSRPEHARVLWWITAAFGVGAVGLVVDVIVNPSLTRMLLHF